MKRKSEWLKIFIAGLGVVSGKVRSGAQAHFRL